MARLQLDLSQTSDALIEKLMPLCDLKTKKDVIENALMLLGWAAAESRNGLSIAAIDLDRKIYKEINTPALEGAKTFEERSRKATGDGAFGHSGGKVAVPAAWS
jgi:hypothetical protein